MRKAIIFLFTVLMSSLYAFAQEVTISGRIIDEVTGKLVPDVRIATQTGFFYSSDGTFSLKLRQDLRFHITFSRDWGYHYKSVKFEDGEFKEIKLSPKKKPLSYYDYVGEDRHGWRRVRVNGLWGYIDQSGEEVCPVIFDEVADGYPEDFSMVRVKQNGYYGFLSSTGQWEYSTMYLETSKEWASAGELVRVRGENMWPGKEIELLYGFVGALGNVHCFYYDAEEELVYAYNPDTDEIDLNTGYAQVYSADGKVGCINQDCQLLLPPEFAEIVWNKYSDEPIWLKGSESEAYVAFDLKTGDCGTQGYHYVSQFDGEDLTVVGSRIQKDPELYVYGYANKKGDIEIPFGYQMAYPFREGLAGVENAGRLAFIDKKGTEVISLPGYAYVYGFFCGLASVSKDGKVGCIDRTGRFVIPCRYDDVYVVNEYCICVKDRDMIAVFDIEGKRLTDFKYKALSADCYASYDDLMFNDRKNQVVYLDLYGNEHYSSDAREAGVKKIIFDKAAAGNIYACFQAADYEETFERKKYWLDKAADKGYLLASAQLGIMYFTQGRFSEANLILAEVEPKLNVEEDDTRKMRLLKKAMRSGANCLLGIMAYNGYGVPKNYEKAEQYLLKSSFEDSFVLLGTIYDLGVLGKRDLQKALDMYIKSYRVTGDKKMLATIEKLRYEQQNEIWENQRKQQLEENQQLEQKIASVEKPKPELPKVSKLALVIGNSAYTSCSMLPNSEKDAEDIAFKLEELGFEVMLYLDQTYRGMREAVEEFAVRASEFDAALFYYAGHGIQQEGLNYLVPVDAILKSATDVVYDCFPANRVMSRLEESGCKMKIMILDACRKVHFESLSRGLEQNGLAPMDAPSGSFIAYSTAPGMVAADGDGDNSPYAEALLTVLDKPGLNILDVFQEVLEIVVNRTKREQNPWTSSSMVGKFYFNDNIE